jgi:hypothetical protein
VTATTIFSNYVRGLRTRSVALVGFLERQHQALVLWWLVLVGFASALRILASPGDLNALTPVTFAPYFLLVCAPIASLMLALRWFEKGDEEPQPTIRMAHVGRWRDVSLQEARRHPLYGSSGIMVSLMIGMLMNVVFRTGEYLMTMPAIGAAAPEWLATLHLAMTLDTVVISSLYIVAFAMALRRVALFPRFLLLVWMLDLTAQMVVAKTAAATGLPTEVAGALHSLLDLNMQKVLISICLWLPYLILSKRVNVTFRHRVPS